MLTRAHLDMLLDLADMASAIEKGERVSCTYYCERVRKKPHAARQFQRLLVFAREHFPHFRMQRDEDGESFVVVDDAKELRTDLEIAFNRLPPATTAVRSVRRKRALRRRRGLCAECGRPSFKITCTRCVARASARRVERRARLVGLGICEECAKQRVEPGRTRCAACLETARRRTDAYRRAASEAGLCPTCRKFPKRPDRATCEPCGEDAARRQRAPASRAKQRALAKARKRAGFCVQCGRRASRGKSMCRKHLVYKRRKQREYARRGRAA